MQGPASRELISRLTDADLSNAAFPYLTAQQIHVGYAPVLAIRVTYVGELGWELHVPAEYALGVWDDLMEQGGGLGIRPVGLQAMSSLRLEKGYRDIGVDIDNTDTPLEAGLGFAVAWDKPGGFTGRDALLAAKAGGRPATASSAWPSTTRPSTCSATSRSCWTATGPAMSAPPPTATPSAARSPWRRSATPTASPPAG